MSSALIAGTTWDARLSKPVSDHLLSTLVPGVLFRFSEQSFLPAVDVGRSKVLVPSLRNLTVSLGIARNGVK